MSWKKINTDDSDENRFQVADDDPGPSELLEQKEFGARLRGAMRKLTRKQWLIFEVVDLEDELDVFVKENLPGMYLVGHFEE